LTPAGDVSLVAIKAAGTGLEDTRKAKPPSLVEMAVMAASASPSICRCYRAGFLTRTSSDIGTPCPPASAKPCAGCRGTIGLAFDDLLNDLQQCRQEHHGMMKGQETLR
jgi:hypothetical protein